MTYSESWPETVTRAEVVCELRKHDLEISELIADLGDLDEYDSEEVLGWMGY
ncbi:MULTISPECIES: hypothetical protein [Pseudomonas putida group]|uniref:Uncharacterized protein n=1 Tax=Pseudomonas putida TaxID=303 RepID=A0AAW6PWQ0_PSEPU|nr:MULTISPECIES: hypothetical protein [Pseudomonas putida group]MDF3874095.1 hypothetical protein [Pseudomonas putida]MDF3880366.1 hypothetical protein [Pseudomonas putida]